MLAKIGEEFGLLLQFEMYSSQNRIMASSFVLLLDPLSE